MDMMDNLERHWAQRRAFLFSHSRTASNLLTRILSGQSDWCISDYHFFQAFQYARTNFNDVKDPDSLAENLKVEHDALLQQGHEKLEQAMISAEMQVRSPNLK
jgi:hypothetical protein